jgi:hypothetical protein
MARRFHPNSLQDRICDAHLVHRLPQQMRGN